MAEGENTATGVRPLKRARAKFPLVLKIFLLMALVIAAVVGSAMLVTIRRAETVATTTVNRAISGAGRLYSDLEQNRLRFLSLGASAVGRDVPFVAYIEDAISPPADEVFDGDLQESAVPVIDTVSILAEIESRREALLTDLVIVTDGQGYLLARTDEPASAGTGMVDLYEEMPLVRFAIEDAPDNPATGIIVSKGRMYHAAVAPIGVGAAGVVQGYLINALLIDQSFADQVAEMSRTSVAFLAVRADQSETTRSTNAPNAESFRAMGEISQVATTQKMSPPHNASIDGGDYLLTAEPLMAAGEVAAVAVFVRSLDAELAPFREIERTLVLAGLVSLVVAFLLSGLVASRVTRPIVHLAEAAQSVAAGDLSVRPKVETHDEVGILASSFSKMVSALRDKEELEELYEQMAARSEASPAAAEPAPATAVDGTVLVTDVRGLTSTLGPEALITLLDEIMLMQEAEIGRQDGEVISITGNQVSALFRGERGVVHAVRSARAIGENLSTMGGDMELSIASGIATGEFVSGGIRTSRFTATTLSGDTPMLATLFAWEAPSGSMFLSSASARQAGSDFLSSATHEEISLRWLPSTLTVAHVPLVGVSTGMIRPVTQPGAAETTVKLDGDTAPAPSEARDLQTGDTFASRYRIEGILGRGGMGVVYKAKDQQLDEIVAIKTLPQKAISSSTEDVERFKREIRLARKITHRNVLRTFDYGEADGWYFISMEYVRGYTLADLLQQTTQMTTRSTLGVMRQISRGLDAAHEQSVIHRDIKPQNVLIDHKGEAKLMDFGIARPQEAEAMTQQGVIVGTPHYMSPEQVQGKALDPRSDVYSMGVVMYEMICGLRPFNSMALTAVLTAHVTQDPVPPSKVREGLEPEIEKIILTCLAKNPAARYADAGELLDALNQVTIDS